MDSQSLTYASARTQTSWQSKLHHCPVKCPNGDTATADAIRDAASPSPISGQETHALQHPMWGMTLKACSHIPHLVGIRLGDATPDRRALASRSTATPLTDALARKRRNFRGNKSRSEAEKDYGALQRHPPPSSGRRLSFSLVHSGS